MYQQDLQDPASTTMIGIYKFNSHLFGVILTIVLLIGWILYSTLSNFVELSQSHVFNFTHSNKIEIVWTMTPAFVLLSLASPSFALLYSLDEISSSILTLKILGHQWYWSYEISDFNSCSDENQNLKYSSYILNDEFLKENNYLGLFRNLETNKRVFLPKILHLRLLLTALDVLHSWAIPSFGVKIDACPGRLNQGTLFIKRNGVFFGMWF